MPSPYTIVLTILAISVAVIIATFAGFVAGLLAHADGASLASAISRGGVTFAATLTLLALLATTVTGFLT